MTSQDWQNDISAAKAAHIDGFAMNIATQDSYTDTVLQTAYDAAATVGGFSMFLSFDYLSGGPWAAQDVITKINTYSGKTAQFKYQGKPLVSTFEGVNNVGDWPNIKAQTGCFFIPSWTSLGPSGFAADPGTADGAFSWDAWPEGVQDMDTSTDQAWMTMLAGKPYMMAVSPWFYTNLPQWGKNWLWNSGDLWYDRWQQVVELQPALVEIITWNDFGESHYIGPIHESGIPSGANYVNNMPHDAWRDLLPHYIDAYKSSNTSTSTTSAPDNDDGNSEKITYWYKLNPANSGSSGGTTGNNPAQGQPALAPQQVSQDIVSLSVLVKEPSDVNVQIGSGSPTNLRAMTAGINHFRVPFNGQTGAVSINVMRSGQQIKSATGPAIAAPSNGIVNWNAYVGSDSGSTSTS